MLNRNYDVIVSGNDWLSLMEALKMLKEGNSVLLIDKYSHSNTMLRPVIGELERNLLKDLGVEWNCNPLIQIDQYLAMASCELNIDQCRLLVGVDAWSNLMELLRKWPEFFQRYHYLWAQMEQLGEAKFNEMVVEHWKELMTADALQSNLKEWILVATSIDQEEGSPLNYALEGLMNKSLPETVRDQLPLSLATALLGQWYFLNVDQFYQELKKFYVSSGGHLKMTTIADMQIADGQVSNILLSSFDGMVSPKSYYSRQELDVMDSGYRAIQGTWKVPFKWAEQLGPTRIVFIESEKLGTNWPWVEIEIVSGQAVVAELVYWSAQGSREINIHQKARDFLCAHMEKRFPEVAWSNLLGDLELQSSAVLWNNNPELLKKRTPGINSLPHPSQFKEGMMDYLRSFFPPRDLPSKSP